MKNLLTTICLILFLLCYTYSQDNRKWKMESANLEYKLIASEKTDLTGNEVIHVKGTAVGGVLVNVVCYKMEAKNEKWYKTGNYQKMYYSGKDKYYNWIFRFHHKDNENIDSVELIQQHENKKITVYKSKYFQSERKIWNAISVDGKRELQIVGSRDTLYIFISGKKDVSGNKISVRCQKRNAKSKSWYDAEKDYPYYFEGGDSKYLWIVRFYNNRIKNVEIEQRVRGNFESRDTYITEYEE